MHHPTFEHEILLALFHNIDINDANGHSLFSLNTSVVHVGGTADVDLGDGVKETAHDARMANSHL